VPAPALQDGRHDRWTMGSYRAGKARTRHRDTPRGRDQHESRRAAIAAILEIGVLSGQRIERSEVGASGEFDALADDRPK
jgi:hypothetical protein